MSKREQQEDFADLYDNAPCGYISLSPDSIITLANRTMADWLNSTVEELTGRPVHDVLSFGGKIAFETHLLPILQLRGSVEEVALDLLDSDAKKFPVLVNAAEKRDTKNCLVSTRLTVFKTVDRRNFERSLIAAKAKAEVRATIEHDALELRDQFIAVLGHDLRNPIAAVAAGVGMLERGGNLSERQSLIVNEMGKSLERANRLIDDVLDLARGKLGGAFAVDLQTDTNIEPALDLIVSEMRVVAVESAISSQISIDHAVDCDLDRIGQLASNLLANAIRHGAREKPIKFLAATTSKKFRISVSNGGEPIPENVLKNLFQPFVRGKSSNARDGLGLGLFIVDEVAKAHNGQMKVSSTKKETKFTFTMPREAPSSI